MRGPLETLDFVIPRDLWVTGFSIQIHDEKGLSQPPQAYLCHASVATGDNKNIVVMVTGQDEVILPPGFGLKLERGQAMSFRFMPISTDPAANKNLYADLVLHAADLKQGERLKRLWFVGDKVEANDCGMPVPKDLLHAQHHWLWLIPPHQKKIIVNQFSFPASGRLHYISGHLHRYGVWMRLADPGGKTLWRGETTLFKDGLVHKMPVYSDAKGIRVEKGKQYIFESEYDNPLEESLESMSQLYMYLLPD